MHQADGRGVSNVVIQARRAEPVTIDGNGERTRAFCSVDDLVDAFLRMMATGPDVTGPINLGNPAWMTIRGLAEAVISMTGPRAELVAMPAPIDDPRPRRPDIGRARTTLDREPKVALAVGPARRTDDVRDDVRQAVP